MKFQQFYPDPSLKEIIACYWIVEGLDVSVNKIIPDGFPELIIHFGDRFEVQHQGNWNVQPVVMIAGQLTQPIFLRPTGCTGVLGIKFHPTAFWKMFKCNMSDLKNSAVEIEMVIGKYMSEISEKIIKTISTEQKIFLLNKFFLARAENCKATPVDKALTDIKNSFGTLSIKDLRESLKVSPRKLERLFNNSVGISAKHYLRLTRFVQTFKLLQQDKFSKAEAAYLCGYFDQSHFNKDFKSFSGENPEGYFGGEHAFAKFLINR